MPQGTRYAVARLEQNIRDVCECICMRTPGLHQVNETKLFLWYNLDQETSPLLDRILALPDEILM